MNNKALAYLKDNFYWLIKDVIEKQDENFKIIYKIPMHDPVHARAYGCCIVSYCKALYDNGLINRNEFQNVCNDIYK